jgi:hypothetical protein
VWKTKSKDSFILNLGEMDDEAALFRGNANPLEKGAQVRTWFFTITVLKAEGSMPKRIRVNLHTDISNPNLCFVEQREDELHRFSPPLRKGEKRRFSR